CCAWSSAGRTACGSRCRASCAPAWWWRSSPPRPPSPRSCWSRERSTGRSIAPAHPPGPTRLRLVRRTACATELSVPGDIRAEDARPAGQILGGVGDLEAGVRQQVAQGLGGGDGVGGVVDPGEDGDGDVDGGDGLGRGQVAHGGAAEEGGQQVRGDVGHGFGGADGGGWAGSGEVGAQEGLQTLFLDQAGVLAVDLGLGGAGGPGGGGDEQGEAGEAGGVADGGVQQGAGAHGGADAVHLLAGEPVVEQPEQVVGEDGPAVVLGDGAAGGPAVAAGVVAQQAGAGQAAAEIEIHEAVAVTAGGEAVELDDGVATLVAQFDIEFGAGNGEG